LTHCVNVAGSTKGCGPPGFAGLQHQAALEHPTAGIPVFLGPAVDLQVHLHGLNLRDLVGALDRLFRLRRAHLGNPLRPKQSLYDVVNIGFLG